MSHINQIKVGIRDSKLSLVQTSEFISMAAENITEINEDDFKINKIKTTGDIKNSERLDLIGGKGLFIKEIEECILDGVVDIGVHSMKDMPAESHNDLEIFCYMNRVDNSDVLISNSGKTLENLESGSVIGTSSIRRRAQLLHYRKDLNIKLLRGNVDTRLKKLKNNDYDAIILAYAGIKRLQIENEITEVLDRKHFLPAGGQGIVGIQSRRNTNFKNLFSKINNHNAQMAMTAERAFLRSIKANCNSPVCVFANIEGSQLNIECQIFSHNGELLFNESKTNNLNEYDSIGSKLGELVIKNLGQDMINNLHVLKDDFNYTS